MLLSLQLIHSSYEGRSLLPQRGASIRGETLTTVVVFVEVSRPKRQKSFYAVAEGLVLDLQIKCSFIIVFF